MSDSAFLHALFPPSNFSPEERELVHAQFVGQVFAKQDYLMRSGQGIPYYYFLESGYARAFAIDPEGNEVTTNFFTAGDIVIDWRSFFLQTPSKEDVQALSPCQAWKITHEGFMKLFHLEAFREVGRTRLVKSFYSLKDHSLSMITDHAKDRYLKLVADKPEIIHQVPLKHIASYLGVTDTSLSRIRKDILRDT